VYFRRYDKRYKTGTKRHRHRTAIAPKGNDDVIYLTAVDVEKRAHTEDEGEEMGRAS